MGPPKSGSGIGPPPPRSGSGRGPPGSGGGRDPQKWWWKRTPGSGSGRGPPQGKDQTRPAEKYCWTSGRYALEKGFLVI